MSTQPEKFDKIVTTAEELNRLLQARSANNWFQKVAVTVLLGNIITIVGGIGILFVNDRLLNDAIIDIRSLKLGLATVDKESTITRTIVNGHEVRIFNLERKTGN